MLFKLLCLQNVNTQTHTYTEMRSVCQWLSLGNWSCNLMSIGSGVLKATIGVIYIEPIRTSAGCRPVPEEPWQMVPYVAGLIIVSRARAA